MHEDFTVSSPSIDGKGGDCRLLAASAAREQTPYGGSHPPLLQRRQKNHGDIRGAWFFKVYGGEGGIRTPGTLRYT